MEIPIADLLIVDADPTEEAGKEDELEVHALLQMSTQAQQRLVKETRMDSEMQQLKVVIQKGWPKVKNDLPEELRKYWNFRDELATHED